MSDSQQDRIYLLTNLIKYYITSDPKVININFIKQIYREILILKESSYSVFSLNQLDRVIEEDPEYKKIMDKILACEIDENVDGNLNSSSKKICPISKKELTDDYFEAECGHLFDKNAAKEFMSRKGNCPVLGCNKILKKSKR